MGNGNPRAQRPLRSRVTNSLREHWPLYAFTIALLAITWWAFS